MDSILSLLVKYNNKFVNKLVLAALFISYCHNYLYVVKIYKI